MTYLYDTSYTGLTPGVQNDNRVALQAAIDDATSKGKGLLITQPYGLSLDSSSVGLYARNNSYIKFTDSGCLRLLNTSTDTYSMIYASGISNSYWTNLRLDGAMENDSVVGGEYGMGFAMYNCSNIGIYDAHIQDMWGDGIYIGGSGTPNSNITIDNPYIRYARRNGISVISVNGLTMWSPTIHAVTQTNPKAGIDFEPNDNSNALQNIKIFDLKTICCNLGVEVSLQGLVGTNAQTVSILINKWTDINSLDTALNRYGLAKGTHSISGTVSIHNVTYVSPNIEHDYSQSYDNSVTWDVTNEVVLT